MKYLMFIIISVAVFFSACNIKDNDTTDGPDHGTIAQLDLEFDSLKAQKVVRLTNGDLDITLVDNSSFGDEHRAGYNGIASMSHSAQDSTVFVPFYAGFNLEHIFGGDSLVELFEPRKHPMELYKISETEAFLYQPLTPLSKVESQTIFKLTSPHFIDITFRFIIHDRKFFKHGYVGLFWASYIHQPIDKKIYFLGSQNSSDSEEWIPAYSVEHGSESTHLWKNDRDSLYFAPNFNATLASHFSNFTYNKSFYYGHFHNMVLAYMFHPTRGIRFSQSPTGGGDKNPAWDFQFIVPDFQVNHEYSFQARMMYKEFTSTEEVHEAYDNWLKTR